jgi:hypothetical protein
LLSRDRERRDFSAFFVFILGSGVREERFLRDFFSLDTDLLRGGGGLPRSFFFFFCADDLDLDRLRSSEDRLPLAL